MAYELKPGDFTISRNEKKEQGDKRPEYTGSGLDLQGNKVFFSLWVKEKDGKKFFSGRMELPYEQRNAQAQQPAQPQAAQQPQPAYNTPANPDPGFPSIADAPTVDPDELPF